MEQTNESNYGIIAADRQARIAMQTELFNTKNWIIPYFQQMVSKNVKTHMKNIDIKRKLRDLKSSHILAHYLYTWKDHIEIHYDAELEFLHFDMWMIHILALVRSGYLKVNITMHVNHHHQYHSRIDKLITVNNRIPCQQIDCTQYRNGLCFNCNEIETIEHFLLFCPRFAQLRYNMLQTIMPLYNNCNLLIDFKQLLFVPNTIGNTIAQRWAHRKMIYHALSTFIIESGRWNLYQSYH